MTIPTPAALKAAEEIATRLKRHLPATLDECRHAKLVAIIAPVLNEQNHTQPSTTIEARAKAAAAELFRHCGEYIAWSPHCESAPVRDYERIILSHFTGLECDERLRDVLIECHPARVWDLARQHYIGGGCGAQCTCSKEHSRRCNLADEAIAKSTKP